VNIMRFKGKALKASRSVAHNISVDEYLTQAEQAERRAAAPLRKELRAQGIWVSWRRGTLHRVAEGWSEGCGRRKWVPAV